MCDRWYYPQSPPLAGAAPHPIVVSVKQRKDSDHRYQPPFVDVPSDLKEPLQAAWQPQDPTTAQLVACVDLVDGGQSLGACKFDDPGPTAVQMIEGVYLVTLYEVATRQKLAELRMTGDGKCPAVCGPDHLQRGQRPTAG